MRLCADGLISSLLNLLFVEIGHNSKIGSLQFWLFCRVCLEVVLNIPDVK